MARNQVCLKYKQLDEGLLEGEREASPPIPTALASALANGKVNLRVRTKKILTPLSSLWNENLKTVDFSYDLIIRTRCFAEEQPQQKYRFQGQHLQWKNSVQEIYFLKTDIYQMCCKCHQYIFCPCIQSIFKENLSLYTIYRWIDWGTVVVQN